MTYDLVVIGAGPGGEVASIRAAQLGMKVALVEKREHLGGTCLNVGCIPTKSLLESAKTWSKLQGIQDLGFSASDVRFDWSRIQQRKTDVVETQRKGLRFLMKKNKIDVLQGLGKLVDPHTVRVEGTSNSEITAGHILLATGSRVRQLPFVDPKSKNILTSDTVLAIDKIPKSMAIVGAGVVGLEFASLFARFGCKVQVLEVAPRALPFEDHEAVDELCRALKKLGIDFRFNVKLTGIRDQGSGAVCVLQNGEETFEKVLVAAGRSPVVEDLGLEKLGIQKTDRGFISVDAHYRTTCPSVFAVGDIIETPALAHTASAEGKHAVEVIAGHSLEPINYLGNPSAIYTHPELASIGHSEEALQAQKTPYKKAKFPFAPMAKAKIEGSTEGFVKILYGPEFHEILGVQIVGGKATELIAEFSLAHNLEATVDEIGSTIHPHPTFSETVMEAAHCAEGHAIHM